MSLAIGVDIGGSHISSAVVDLKRIKLIPGTYFVGKVNNKASKESILETWGRVISNSIRSIEEKTLSGIGIAIPGPFRYEKGIAMYEINDKYEALYKVNVGKDLSGYISDPSIPIKFLNDASCFGLGSSVFNSMEKKVLALTLGTGFGATFIKNQIPLVDAESVPEDGCLWNKPFRDGIADDYFSTRWFLTRYTSITGGKQIQGVRELVTLNNEYTIQVFREFSENLGEFLTPYMEDFKPDLLVIGGNISKSYHLFLPQTQRYFTKNNCNPKVEIKLETDKSIILGASLLFHSEVSPKIQQQLPKI